MSWNDHRLSSALREAAAKPQRIQLSRAKGWKLPPNTIVVSRPTKWGNPFVVGRDGDRARCVDLYCKLLRGLICLSCGPAVDEQKAVRAWVFENLRTLRGKNLACWCPLPKPGEIDRCHAAVLIDLANGYQP